jgi:hypothetical protein
MDYKIAICSHNRIDTLKKKTLRVLELYGIEKEKIFVFVAPDEVADYRAALLGYTVVEGALGLCANRNAVVAYFPEGTPVFFLDDDIRGFLEYTTQNQRHERQLEDLHALIVRGFEEVQKAGLSLWGIYPVANGRWMKPCLTRGLLFCYGCSFGLLIRKDTLNQQSFKEDYERSLRFYKRDGSVLRLNWVAPLQSFCRGSGGLNAERTAEKEKEGCERLQKEFPDLMSYAQTKGKWVIRLKRTVHFLQDV